MRRRGSVAHPGFVITNRLETIGLWCHDCKGLVTGFVTAVVLFLAWLLASEWIYGDGLSSFVRDHGCGGPDL